MRDEFRSLANRDESQYFFIDHLDEIGERHVAWIDIMGVLDRLRHNQTYPAVARGELFSVVSEHIAESQAQVTTVGDGVIILTEDREYLVDFLDALMLHYARFNVTNWRDDEDIWLLRLPRVGVGSGDIHKIDTEYYSEDNLRGNVFHDDFRNEPFGPGMIRAMESERGAPFSIHESARHGDPQPIRWWENINLEEEPRIDTVKMLKEYFDWYDSHYRYDYSPYSAGHYEATLDYFDVDESQL